MKKTFTIISIILLALLIIYLVISTTQKVNPITKNVNPLTYGSSCKLIEIRKNLAEIDCNSAADGALLYVNKSSGQIVSKCGGYCMGGGCKPGTCPPKEWNE